jgi:hypothetical protein
MSLLEICGGLAMKCLSSSLSALVVLTCLASTPVSAQTHDIAPRALPALNPSLSLSAPATTPLQEQMRQDYATGLIGVQRDLLQQNPTGVGRQELEIGHELNGYVPQ